MKMYPLKKLWCLWSPATRSVTLWLVELFISFASLVANSFTMRSSRCLDLKGYTAPSDEDLPWLVTTLAAAATSFKSLLVHRLRLWTRRDPSDLSRLANRLSTITF